MNWDFWIGGLYGLSFGFMLSRLFALPVSSTETDAHITGPSKPVDRK